MLKRHALIKFILIAIISVLGILLCVCPFGVPYSSMKYNGFLNATKKGLDINGGVSAVYECTLNKDSKSDLGKAIDNSLQKLTNIFEYERFTELTIKKQGGSRISLLASNSEVGALDLNDAFTLIEDRKDIFFTVDKAEEGTTPTIYLNGNDIFKVYPDYDYEGQTYGLSIEFDSTCRSKVEQMKNLSKNTTDQKVYIYLEEVGEDNLFVEMDYDDIKADKFFVSSSGTYSTSSITSARELAYSIAGGTLEVDLKLREVSPISPIFGRNTQLLLGISILVTIFLTCLLLFIRYRDLGTLANISLSFYLIFFLFLLQAIPFVTINLAGVIGSVAAFLFAALAHAFVFEKIRDEYKIGKKLHLSCKGGFKKALIPLLDLHAIVGLSSILVWALAPSALKILGFVMFMGTLLSLLCSLVLLRLLVNNYLRINSTKANKLNLRRDKNTQELKDEEVEIIREEDLASQEEVENA